MSITDLVSALGSHNYLALFILLALYARKLSGPDSKFPLDIPPAWAPTVTATFGLVYGVLASHQGGQSWGTAALTGFVTAGSTGFLDGLLTAIFNHGNAPGWARAIVFIVDDITGSGSGSGSSSGSGTAPTLPKPLTHPSPIPPPPAATLRRLALLGFTYVTLSGCGKLPPGTPADVQAEVDCVQSELTSGVTSVATIAKVCTKGEEQLASDLIAMLLDSSESKVPPDNATALRAQVKERSCK